MQVLDGNWWRAIPDASAFGAEPAVTDADAEMAKKHRALLVGGLAVGAAIGATLMHFSMKKGHTRNRRRRR